MKKLKKLSLSQLSKNELQQREMGSLVGGSACGCGCNGSSTTYTNGNANWNNGYSSSGGGNKVCQYWSNVGEPWNSNF